MGGANIFKSLWFPLWRTLFDFETQCHYGLAGHHLTVLFQTDLESTTCSLNGPQSNVWGGELILFAVPGIEPKALYLLARCSTSELYSPHPYPPSPLLRFYFELGSHSRRALNQWQPVTLCLSLSFLVYWLLVFWDRVPYNPRPTTGCVADDSCMPGQPQTSSVTSSSWSSCLRLLSARITDATVVVLFGATNRAQGSMHAKQALCQLSYISSPHLLGLFPFLQERIQNKQVTDLPKPLHSGFKFTTHHSVAVNQSRLKTVNERSLYLWI